MHQLLLLGRKSHIEKNSPPGSFNRIILPAPLKKDSHCRLSLPLPLLFFQEDVRLYHQSPFGSLFGDPIVSYLKPLLLVPDPGDSLDALNEKVCCLSLDMSFFLCIKEPSPGLSWLVNGSWLQGGN